MVARCACLFAVVAAALMLASPDGFCQSGQQGMKFFKEAKALADKAKSDEEWKSVADLYETALQAFEKAKDQRNTAATLYNLGWAFLKLKRFQEAGSQFERVAPMCRKLGDTKMEGRSLRSLGVTHMSNSRYDKALVSFEAALSLARKSGDSVGQAWMLNDLGLTCQAMRQYEAALGHYQKGLELSKKQKDQKQEALITHNIGLTNRDMRDYAKAQEYLEKAMEMRKKGGDLPGQGKILADLALMFRLSGRHAEALETYDKCIETFQKAEDKVAEARVLAIIGDIYRDTGQPDRALEHYEKALDMARQRADSKGEGWELFRIADFYGRQSKYGLAVEFYEQSLDLATKMGDRRMEASSLSRLGEVSRRQGDFTRALVAFEQCLEIYKALQDERQRGWILIQVGSVYQARSDIDKALAYYTEAGEIAVSSADMGLEASSLASIGGVLFGRGETKRALEHHERRLELLRKTGDLRGQAYAIKDIGIAFNRLGNSSEAMENYEKFREICTTTGDVSGEATALRLIADMHLAKRQSKKAFDYYQRASDLAQQSGEVLAYADALVGQGAAHTSVSQYGKALGYYDKALEIYRMVGNKNGEGFTLRNFGNIYAALGRHAKAVECLIKSQEIAEQTGNAGEKSQVLNDLGCLYLSLGQHAKASEYLEQALKIREQAGDVRGQAQTLGNLGHVCAARDDHAKALSCYEQSLELYERIGLPAGYMKDTIANLYLDMGRVEDAAPLIREVGFFASLGRLELEKSDHKAAESWYLKLQTLAEKNRDFASLFASHTGLGITRESLGQTAEAVEHFRKAIELTEEARSIVPLGEKDSFFDVRVRGLWRTAPYKGLARALVQMGNPQDALRESEFTKARVFAERLSRNADRADALVPRELIEQDFQINEQTSALLRSVNQALDEGNTEVAAILQPQIEELKHQLAEHKETMRKQYPLFAATRYPEPLSLQQTAVEDDEWVLSYDVSDSGMLVFLTRGKNLVKALFKPVQRKRLDGLVRAFRQPLEVGAGESLSDKLTEFDLVSGKQLADLLLEDVLAELPRKVPLIVIPDDCLGVLPFEMLVLNERGKITTDRKVPQLSGADFFGDRNPISYYQSLTALTLARTLGKKGKTQDRLLCIADPVFQMQDARIQAEQPARVATGDRQYYQDLMYAVEEASGGTLVFARLPQTGILAETLGKLFQGNADVYTGLDASKEIVLTTIATTLERYGSIVFATHGFFDKDNPGFKEPILALSMVPPGTDGFLRMSEVMGLKMNAGVVALTACQSGLGRTISGEGTMGMGRAFQYAGSRSVLMSLWSVAESSSVDLVGAFFKHLQEGRSKLEALRLARKQIRDAGYDHPFFWAPFILVGESD